MDTSDFSGLIGRLEREADTRPQLYVAKVVIAAALGYALPALAAVVILVVCYFTIYAAAFGDGPSMLLILTGVAAVALLAVTVRALIVPIAAAEGVQISRDDAPQLFALIDDIGAKIGGAPLASVTINGEFVASIQQIPRWGVFGGYRHHLQLGVPLLIALSIDELTAVLAHEIGHFGGRDRPFSGWIYRQRPVWQALGQKFAEPQNTVERMLGGIYGWYAPWFCAYSFALARDHEYGADHVSAAITSTDTLGRALIKIELAGRFLAEVFWARFLSRVEESPEPPYRPYSLLPRAFKVAEKENARSRWLAEALRRYTTDGDTHPSLAERLATLEVAAELPPPSNESIALLLFGGLASRLIHYCDEVWRGENLANWRKRHDAIKEARWKIAQYEQYDNSVLRAEDLWAKANMQLTLNQEADAIETLQHIVGREAAHADAHMLLARLLLSGNDERGLPHLLLAAEQKPELANAAGSIGYSYLVERGRKGEAMRFWQRISPLISE
ncbi:MAG: M48 family metalloprotease [Steroidobacteraceae bacterium]